MTTCPPWKEYPELKEYFTDEEQPPYTELSGNHSKMIDLYNYLINHGYFEFSDNNLVLLIQKYTNKIIDKNFGEINVIQIPNEFMLKNEADVSLCHRKLLSKKAYDKISSIYYPGKKPLCRTFIVFL